MVKFEKPAISIPDQIALLKRRGLIIDNVAQAECCPSLISYYRLRPYWLPFEVPTQPGGDHAFREHFTFEDVLALYWFERVFTSFCHHMSHIRNICAHQGRLWNKRFIITIKVPQHPINLTQAFHDPESRRLHNTLIILDHILTIVAPETEWRKRILQLINSCPLVNPVSMGFPANWRELPAWQVSRAD